MVDRPKRKRTRAIGADAEVVSADTSTSLRGAAGVGVAGELRTGKTPATQSEAALLKLGGQSLQLGGEDLFLTGGATVDSTNLDAFANQAFRADAAVLYAEPGKYGIAGQPVQSRARTKAKVRTAAAGIRNKAQLVGQVYALIVALEDALRYKPLSRGNQKQPDLYSELSLSDPTARKDIKALVKELKRLNDFLQKTPKPKVSSKPVIEVRKHLNTFLKRFATTAGYGAGLLAVAVAANVIASFGVDFSIMPVPIRHR